MDFNDTPEEAEFRAEARAFLEEHTQPLAEGESPGGIGERGDGDATPYG